MSILDALKKLIIKRGGTAKGSNIAEVISNYANEDSPSPSGGGGVVLEVVENPVGAHYGIEASYNDIYQFLSSGVPVILKNEVWEDVSSGIGKGLYTSCRLYVEGSNGYRVKFGTSGSESTYVPFEAHQPDDYMTFTYD